MKNAFLMLVVLLVAACAPQTAMNATNSTDLNDTNSTLPANFTTVRERDTPQPIDGEVSTERDFAATIEYTEGDLVQLSTRATDPDGDEVTITYGEPLSASGAWQTEIGDAGDYVVTIVATDEQGAATEQEILLTIRNANRAPMLEGPDAITVREGETVEIDATATDPDGDDVILSYSGWMQSNTYTTTFDDAGEHNVTIIAEDGKLSSRKTVLVTVENVNRPPVLELAQTSYETTELETVAVQAEASDPDGDEVTITYGEPLSASGTWTPQLDDDGEYTVTVTATDGTESVTEEVQLVVNRANRAPVIEIIEGEDLTYAEGDFINLRTALDISDEEGEEVVVYYSGWMTGAVYQTDYDDAGEHIVTVTAEDDSGHKVSRDVTVRITNTNRPPVFTRPA